MHCTGRIPRLMALAAVAPSGPACPPCSVSTGIKKQSPAVSVRVSCPIVIVTLPAVKSKREEAFQEAD